MKKLLTILGLITIITPTTMSAVACNSGSHENKNTDTVIEAINNFDYQKEVESGSLVKDLISSININFLKENLSDEIKNSLNDTLEIINVTKENGNQLNDIDLAVPETLSALINYKYNEQTSKTKLTIKITENNSQKVVEAINNTETYKVNILSRTNVEKLKEKINNDFIKNELNEDIKKIFQTKFSLNAITLNDSEITDDDLLYAEELYTQIHYEYGEIKNQEVNLTISLENADETIINNINHTNYVLNDIVINTKVDQIKEMINNEFIKKELNEDIKKIYWDAFVLENILNEADQNLTNDDLTKTGTIKAKINYQFNWGGIEKTNLTIKVTNKANKKFDLGSDWVTDCFQGENGSFYAITEGTVWEIDLKNNEANNLGSMGWETEHIIKVGNDTLYGFSPAGWIIKFDLKTHKMSKVCEIKDKVSKLILGPNGNLYAATMTGDYRSAGIWEIDLKTNTATKKYSFAASGNNRIESWFTTENSLSYAFTQGGKVFEIDLSRDNISPSEIVSTPDYKFSPDSIQISDNEVAIIANGHNDKNVVYSFDFKTKRLNEIFNQKMIVAVFKNKDQLYASVRKENLPGSGYEYDIYELNPSSKIDNIKIEEMISKWIWGQNNKLYGGTSSGSIYEILI